MPGFKFPILVNTNVGNVNAKELMKILQIIFGFRISSYRYLNMYLCFVEIMFFYFGALTYILYALQC